LPRPHPRTFLSLRLPMRLRLWSTCYSDFV
jgi:hypothetical protein